MALFLSNRPPTDVIAVTIETLDKQYRRIATSVIQYLITEQLLTADAVTSAKQEAGNNADIAILRQLLRRHVISKFQVHLAMQHIPSDFDPHKMHKFTEFLVPSH